MDKREIEQLASIVARELGSNKEDTELIESIRQNRELFEAAEKKMAPSSKGTRVIKSPF